MNSTNLVDLRTSSNEIKVSFKTNLLLKLLSLKQFCCAYFECICGAMLDSINLPHKAFAEPFVLVLFK